MKKHRSLFRDPSGFIFTHDEEVYRQVNDAYKKSYDLLIASGLYDELCAKNYMVKHEEMNLEPFLAANCYKTIKPDQISFISYPFVLDLTNPSLGWGNLERIKIGEHGHADLVLALALIHHLCIGNNVPLEREDVFTGYDQENFEKQFLKYYDINEYIKIEETCRHLYLMKKSK